MIPPLNFQHSKIARNNPRVASYLNSAEKAQTNIKRIAGNNFKDMPTFVNGIKIFMSWL